MHILVTEEIYMMSKGRGRNIVKDVLGGGGGGVNVQNLKKFL